MLRLRRTGSTIAIILVLTTATACGTDDGPDAPGAGGQSLLGPQVGLTFDLGGAVTLKGKQTAAAPSLNGTFLKSCADYAKGTTQDGGKVLYAIAGLLDGSVDGRKVTLELLVDDYTGPGAYPKDRLVALGSEPSIAVDNRIYSTWPDSTSSKVVTDSKGGGTWTFAKLATTGPGGLPGDAVTGSVKWTCRNP